MAELLAALGPFGLGLLNMANPCVLPLYPGFLAYLAGNQQVLENRRLARWLGVLTMLGVLVSMLSVGLVLAALQVAVGRALALLLPFIFGIVILMGVLLVLNVNLLSRLPMMRSPRLKNPALSSFLYGLLFGPMTLPCSGTLVVGVFGYSTTAASLIEGILYVMAFGLGFGLPLLVLPFLAQPVRKSLLRWMTTHHDTLMRVAGVILIAVGVLGIINDWPLISNYWGIGAGAPR